MLIHECSRQVRDPRITVVSNVDAKPYRDAKHVCIQTHMTKPHNLAGEGLYRALCCRSCASCRCRRARRCAGSRRCTRCSRGPGAGARGARAGAGGSRRCWRWARAARSEPRSSRSTPRPGTTACRSTSDAPSSPHCKYHKYINSTCYTFKLSCDYDSRMLQSSK